MTGLVGDGRPLDALVSDLEALDEVDLAGVNAVARSGLYDWDALTIVLVGDRAAIEPQLAEAGFPTPEGVGTDGRRVP